MMQRLGAEFLGTFMLVFIGCGVAVLGAPGLLGVALAFGLALTVAGYAIGHISGGHYNPAITLAMAVNGRFLWKEVIPYIIAQVLGGLAGAGILYMIVSGKAEASMLAANGFGDHSVGGFGQNMAMLTEVILTALFVIVVLGATSGKGSMGHAPLAIGLAFAILMMVGATVTGGSLNPARSTGSAVVAGGWAMDQLWMFWVAPLIGALVGGYLYKWAICCGMCSTNSSCSM